MNITYKNATIKFRIKSLLCFILKTINKISNQNFIAITNPFTKTIHCVDTKLKILIESKAIERFEEYSDLITLFKHEYTHIIQIRELGIMKFLWLYVIYSIKYGYSNNPLEIDAYKNEMDENFTDYQYIK